MDKPRIRASKNSGGRKANAKKVTPESGSKTVELAALAAVGMAFGPEAIAAMATPDRVSTDKIEAELARETTDKAQVEKDRADDSDQVAKDAESDKEAVAEGDESDEDLVAEGAEGDEEVAASDESEPILVADASNALGVQSDESFQLAQAPSAAPNAAGAAAKGKAASAGAAEAGAADGAAAGAGAAEAAGGAAFAGLSPLAIGALGLGVAAAAGGGGSAAAAAIAPAGVGAGIAAKGLLSGSTVFYDFNGDGTYTAGVDPSATTGATGRYSIDLTAAQKTQVESGLNNLGKQLKLIVTGGTDVTNGTPFTGSLSAAAPRDTSVEGKINVFTTLKAAGMSENQLTQLLGVNPDTLTADDFNEPGDAVESLSLKLWSLVSDKIGADADKAEAAMSALGNALEQLSGQGDLQTMLATMSASQLDLVVGPLVDGAIELYDAGYEINEIDQMLGAAADSLDASGVFADLSDGVVDDDHTAAFAAAEAAVEDLRTNIDATSATVSNLAATYGADVRYNESGVATHFVISEDDALAISELGISDPFAAAIGLDLVLQVEGTLLGTADNPLTFAQLAALGVDVISDGTASGAGYLHLTSDNFTNLADDNAFLEGMGDAEGSLGIYVDGTILDSHPLIENLGVASHAMGSEWDGLDHFDLGT